MQTGMQLAEYLSNGAERIVKGIWAASYKNPEAGLFMAKYVIRSKIARSKRAKAEREGEHIPPFLIASITDRCNLRCKGCYARANHSCTDACGQGGDEGLLTGDDWASVFSQAEELGIEFILLAGGEPFIRRDVIREAGRHPGILFPIFTNGTMLDGDYVELLARCRNLLPVISLEGGQPATDARRGEGVYQRLSETMSRLREKGILFGVSVTVTVQNLREVMSDEFVQRLKSAGAKGVIYVEYVPVDGGTRPLAPDGPAREEMESRICELRRGIPELILLSFPGDERVSEGCLAAGRGFFHINARGGAEPCPFSPYSDTNVMTSSLTGALHSPLFRRITASGNLEEEHIGGCVLFEQQEQVEAMLADSRR